MLFCFLLTTYVFIVLPCLRRYLCGLFGRRLLCVFGLCMYGLAYILLAMHTWIALSSRGHVLWIVVPSRGHVCVDYSAFSWPCVCGLPCLLVAVYVGLFCLLVAMCMCGLFGRLRLAWLDFAPFSWPCVDCSVFSWSCVDCSAFAWPCLCEMFCLL